MLKLVNLRRLVLDIHKSVNRPSLVELSEVITRVSGVEAINITVTEMDVGTMGLNVTVEGQNIDHEALMKNIEELGAVIQSIDEVAAGKRLIENIKR
ncbi:MAG: DUF211 domain-containing protein [Candidatus Thermoplasmatota archaeon]|nr:DUF211 domain-containing protein [Candidatus Thermoplasmatota archaeon]